MVIPIYCMPGMAASPKIFQHLKLSSTKYSIYTLTWKIPLKGENLKQYTVRMLEEVKHENPVLLGVSFGGVIVQEMAKLIPCRKVIIVSSVKSKDELPRRMKIARALKLYAFAPVGIVQAMRHLPAVRLGKKIDHRLALYKEYLSVDDPHYLRWAIKQVLQWDQEKPAENLVHIHGDADPVFPFKYIKKCIVVRGGSHVMIVTKYAWFNQNLPRILED